MRGMAERGILGSRGTAGAKLGVLLVAAVIPATACAPRADAPADTPGAATEAGSGEGQASAAAPAAQPGAGAVGQGAPAQRVALPPTPADSLPRAIVGRAPPPQGIAINYFADDPATRGYLAVPPGEGPFPAVILIHEWNGLVDRIRQTADALAAEGYVALAADLFSGRVGTSREENIGLIEQATSNPQRLRGNLDAAVRYLRQQPYVTGRIGTIGWCFGGGVVLSYAVGGDNHDATAVFYGSLLDDPARLAQIPHEVYGTFAERDEGIPPEQVRQFVEALRAAGVPNDVHIYDDVEHGFWLWVEEDPENRRAPALDSWQRLKAHLNRTLRRP